MTTHADQVSTIIRDKRGRLVQGRPPFNRDPGQTVARAEERPPNTVPAAKRAGKTSDAVARAEGEKCADVPPSLTLTATRPREIGQPQTGLPCAEGRAEPLKPLVVSTRDARELLGRIGNSLLWKLIGQGRLETIRLGARRMVVVASIERLIDEQPAEVA